MRRKLQKFFFGILLLSLGIKYHLNAEDVNTDNLLINLQDRNFSIDFQGLTPAESSNFPQNIILTKQNGKTENQIVLAFTKEHVSKCENEFISFLDKIGSLELDSNLVILLSTNDENIYFDDADNYHPKGTEIFTSTLTDSNVKCAVIAKEKDNSMHEIISGGNGEISPLWIVQALTNSCTLNKSRFHIPNSTAFLYRLKLIDNDQRLSCFLRQSIPSAGITIGYTQTDFNILCTFLESLKNNQTAKWDRHYSYFHIPYFNLEIWLNETFYILCFIIFSFFILLIICFRSFSKSQRNLARFKDMFRTWYIIPAIILITAIILQYSQNFFITMTDNPTILICDKIISTFILINILFILQVKTSFKVSNNFSKYSIILISGINTFLFCGIDLSFLFLFFFELCICLVACKITNVFSIFLSLLLMMIPFIPSSFNFIASSNSVELLRFASPDILGNLLISFIIFPFEIQWQRLLISIYKRIKLRMPIAIFFLISISAFIYFCFTNIYKYAESKYNNTAIPVDLSFSENDSQNYVNIETTSEKYMEFNINRIRIKGNENSTILRYDIYIESENSIPLYDCNFEYIILGKNRVLIRTPDFPISDLEIVYSCDNDINQMVNIISYFKTLDNKLLKESDTLFIDTN